MSNILATVYLQIKQTLTGADCQTCALKHGNTLHTHQGAVCDLKTCTDGTKALKALWECASKLNYNS